MAAGFKVQAGVRATALGMPLARYRCRDRYWISVSAMATYTEEEIEALRNVATEGAKLILDGATEFPVWADRMLLDAGDQIRWVSMHTGDSLDDALSQIYEHAVRIADLMQAGRRLAATAWIHHYAEVVTKKSAASGSAADRGILQGPVPGSANPADGFSQLCKHPAAYQDSPGIFVVLGLFALLFVYFVITDPSAFLHNGFAMLSLIVTGFFLLLGLAVVYGWVDKRHKRRRSKRY